ncbi:hypothetical protein [Sulfuracidifex tepidarius]|uniref:Uncharacterized protein n=1 Tax=Sulfuracidifex tepidarius TaxID=1294262 RepID=A0A510E145_9CREN|nr:hypothetical protein [Sulfuracidifex tepidarius]BBG23463.1 hypothetical protein IC006_0747 [Sulfuracidifex tepidarius]BBG26215.1 hypothetical protein IC007_0720 [Sulfuracidifex tepidarius]
MMGLNTYTDPYEGNLDVGLGYTQNGRAFIVLTEGLPNDSITAFNVLKVIEMNA